MAEVARLKHALAAARSSAGATDRDEVSKLRRVVAELRGKLEEAHLQAAKAAREDRSRPKLAEGRRKSVATLEAKVARLKQELEYARASAATSSTTLDMEQHKAVDACVLAPSVMVSHAHPSTTTAQARKCDLGAIGNLTTFSPR